MNLKETIKHFAYQELSVDLVGFGNIERCREAPLMMSPQGLMPDARTVLVMALRHPDSCVELGGEDHPQDIGPYSVQYLMNSCLDFASYRMATFLEKQGYAAIPIASSNIWRYNQYKNLKAIFAPDISHIYMAVVAGLADMGYSGLALTPEFGARNRFVTVVTNALVDPDPLLPPGSVCDKCLLCRKHCPTRALVDEIDGDKVLKIDNFEYRFANKNLWRCAWGEHFDLDVDLPIPDMVTEKIIKENVLQHGLRGGEMGQCLKFCLPQKLRSWNREYSKSPVRKSAVMVDEDIEPRGMIDQIIARLYGKGAGQVIVHSAAELAALGVALEQQLPGAESAITITVEEEKIPGGGQNNVAEEIFQTGTGLLVDSMCYDLTRDLENLGFRSVMTMLRSERENVTGQILQAHSLPNRQRRLYANTVITRKRLVSRPLQTETDKARTDSGKNSSELTLHLRDYLKDAGADLVGVAPVSRFTEIAQGIRPVFDNQAILAARDCSHRFKPWQPEIKREQIPLRLPEDWLPGAKSVVVFALRYHREVLRQAIRPPAEAVGPYAFLTYVTRWRGAMIAGLFLRHLQDLGYQGAITMDLMNTGSCTANPRNLQEDLCSNRFAAIAAGLGEPLVNGHVASAEFGIRQRFVAVVTDADLVPSAIKSGAEIKHRCEECNKPCIATCPTRAIGADEIRFSCEGKRFSFNSIDRALCDWSKRYALKGDCGFKYLGSQVDIDPGQNIDEEKLTQSLMQLDPIKKYRPAVAEPCVVNCPYAV